MPSFQKPPTVSDDYRAVDIYRKAANIIYEKGFNATSMGDIADAVDLTKGGLYYYIKGKKALLFAIMNFAMDQLEAEVLAPARSEVDPRSRLANMVGGHIRVVLQDPSAMTILVYEEENLSAEHRVKIVSRKNEYEAVLRESIRAVIDQQHPTGAHIDPAVAAYSVLGMVHWIVRWYQREGRLSQDQIVHQMTHLVLNGLMTPLPSN
ncbi:MAG: TetR/AcrR family transcriptional regulator [Acidobacteriota bacterium]